MKNPEVVPKSEASAVMGAVFGTSFWLGLSTYLEGALVTATIAAVICVLMLIAIVILFFTEAPAAPQKGVTG